MVFDRAFLFQGLLGLGVWWVVQRYISESLMLLIFLTLLGLRALDLQSSDFKNRVFRGLLVFACVWSIFVSTASAWTWAVETNGVTPREFKVRMKEIMLDADWAVYRITHRQ
jgi:hypothetical protein